VRRPTEMVAILSLPVGINSKLVISEACPASGRGVLRLGSLELQARRSSTEKMRSDWPNKANWIRTYADNRNALA
jgi:hypothetical protein